MRKNLRHKFALLVLATGTLGLTACSDNANDSEALAPSTIDPKQWTLDAYMDTSVKPGDDFARYCWGTWYNENKDKEGDAGIWQDSEILQKSYVNSLNRKESKILESDLSNLGENEEEIEKLRQRISHLMEVRNEGNPYNIAKELGEFLAAGKNSLISREIDAYGNKGYYGITLSSKLTPNIQKPDVLPSDITPWLMTLGLSEENAQEVAENALTNEFKGANSIEPTEGRPEAGTNPDKEEGVNEYFCQGLGIDKSQLKNYVSKQVGLGEFIGQNATHLVDMMMCYEAADILLMSKAALEESETCRLTYSDDFLTSVTETLLCYPQSKEYSDKYCTTEMRNMAFNLMEDLRTTFAQRIDSRDWMSSTTKQEAKNKLNQMKFFACYPDNWIDCGFPQLKGNSLYEDVVILRQTWSNLCKELLSHDPREDQFNYALAQGYTTYLVNCFYTRETNTACIFAPFLMKPFYSTENSDATLYAIGCVMGHEMTHGFDNGGALYGPKGENVNWWTVADKQEFDTRAQLLVDCYNHLPGYIDCPGNVFAKGEKTLGENIADIGGLELALQLYTTKMTQQGYYGDELVKQQKRFFQAFANIWRIKGETKTIIEDLATDTHANNYTRILGTTMNCDRWYELYDVKWGDKNYLFPEKRTHIW